ncbi:MAG: ribosomal L7Ae/L30e/S12e/Gadd45 family protein [archaeon]
MNDLKKAVKEKELTLGSKKTLDKIKQGKVKVVYLANDCKADVKRDIMQLAKVSDIKIKELDINGIELGTLVKKQFSVSVLSY